MPHAVNPTLDLTLLPDALAVCRLPAGFEPLDFAFAALGAAGHRIARLDVAAG